MLKVIQMLKEILKILLVIPNKYYKNYYQIQERNNFLKIKISSKK